MDIARKKKLTLIFSIFFVIGVLIISKSFFGQYIILLPDQDDPVILPPPPPPPDDDPDPLLPENPSIIINNGEPTTELFDVILELSCENADEMRFRYSLDYTWTNWEYFIAFKTVLLPESSIYYPYYNVSVQYRNIDGVSDVVSAEITIVTETEPIEPVEPLINNTPNTQTLIYGGLITLASILGIIVLLEFLVFKKRRKK